MQKPNKITEIYYNKNMNIATGKSVTAQFTLSTERNVTLNKSHNVFSDAERRDGRLAAAPVGLSS